MEIMSKVECSLHICQEIYGNTNISLFEKTVTREMNNYFKMYQLQELNANDVDIISNSELLLKFSVSEIGSIQSPDSEAELFIPWWIWLIISIVVLFISILAYILYKCKKRQNHKQLEAKTTHIYNPMVITVAIGFYEQGPKQKEINGYLKDIEGVRHDVKNTIALFGNNQDEESLNYDIYPTIYIGQNINNYKAWWEETELKQFLQKQADELESNLKSDDKKYDSLLVFISCHGIKGYIITSDYKKIEKEAIHRIFSANKPSSRKIPRIFLFDCCSGDADRDTDFRCQIEEEDEFTKGNQDTAKQITTAEIEQDVTWARDEKNPDYKLVVINAANDGFQSKMRSDSGSYVINRFVDNLRNNIFINNNEEFLNDILSEIQNSLHDAGKQLITKMFNNDTDFIKFHPNIDNNNNTEMALGILDDELKGIKKSKRNQTRTSATDKSKQEHDEIGKSVINNDNDKGLEMKSNESNNINTSDDDEEEVESMNEYDMERYALIIDDIEEDTGFDDNGTNQQIGDISTQAHNIEMSMINNKQSNDDNQLLSLHSLQKTESTHL